MSNKKPEDTTVVFTDIKEALSSSEREATDRPAALLAVGGELNGTIFNLHEGQTVVGRGAECELTLEFAGISRRHLSISVDGEKVDVTDCGSRNGTYINNEKLEGKHRLQKQDMIKIGSVALKYIPKGDPERLAYDKLTHEANTDALTSAYNKAYFNNQIDLEVKKSKVIGSPLSLIIFDLDLFKKLNDNHGHDAGDFILKELSAVVRGHGVREQDVYARYGGEEFVILLPKTNIKQAFEIAERIRRLIEGHHFVYDAKQLPVTISVGVADYRQGVKNGTDLFRRADGALYQAKEGGRNQVNFFKE